MASFWTWLFKNTCFQGEIMTRDIYLLKTHALRFFNKNNTVLKR